MYFKAQFIIHKRHLHEADKTVAMSSDPHKQQTIQPKRNKSIHPGVPDFLEGRKDLAPTSFTNIVESKGWQARWMLPASRQHLSHPKVLMRRSPSGIVDKLTDKSGSRREPAVAGAVAVPLALSQTADALRRCRSIQGFRCFPSLL